MPRSPSKAAPSSPRLAAMKSHRKAKVNSALSSNAQSALLVAGILKGSFGPRGLDKMFLDKLGAVHATSDGAEILNMSQSEHPIARLITQMGKTVDREVGDGTVSAVILMGTLLEQGVKLVERGLHPSIITKGYTMALAKALEELNEMAEPVPYDSKDWLLKVAETSIQAKLAVKGSTNLPEMLVTAALGAIEKRGDRYLLDVDKISVQRMPGGALSDTRLIQGMVLEKDLISREAPRRLENAKIIVGDISLVIKKTIADAKITMTDSRMVSKLGQQRRYELKRIGDRIIASGANVLINREGCDDLVADQLAKAGIMAVRHVKIKDVANVAQATGATIVDAKRDIRPEDLGFAALVEERKVEGAPRADKWVFIEGCRDPKAMCVLLRGGNWFVVDEADRSVHDALMVMKDLVEKPSVVAGGGAVEAEVAHRVRDWSTTLHGREQLAAVAFADALEEIPGALAEKAGVHAVDAMAEIRARHARGEKWSGVDSRDGKVKDTYAAEIVEPLLVKEQVLKAAAETACIIIRIDSVMKKEVRAYRRKSEMTEEQRSHLRPATSREDEEFQDRAEHFPINVPHDTRYPL